MNQRRVDFFLGTMGDCLIAVGGRNENGAVSSVEMYHPAEDYWTYVSGLPRSFVSSAVLLDWTVFCIFMINKHHISLNKQMRPFTHICYSKPV